MYASKSLQTIINQDFVFILLKVLSNMTVRRNNYSRDFLAILLVGGCLISLASAGVGDGGSVCQDTSCTGAPLQDCEPRYERDDKCCPVWHCRNGQTAYGASKSMSSGSGSSYSYSSSSGSGPPQMGQGGNPFASIMNNIFGGGGLFG